MKFTGIISVLFIIIGFSSCERDEEVLDAKVVFTDKIPNIRSVFVREDSTILIDGLSGNLYLTLVDDDLNILHHSMTDFRIYDNVYHPFNNIEVIMKSGDYTFPGVGAYISHDLGRSFLLDFGIEPEWGDWWNVYIPINENSYFLCAGSEWKSSNIITIQNNTQVSGFYSILEGYNIVKGIYHNNILHVIANEVSNTQPSYNPDIYYFYSTDRGQTWRGKTYIGELEINNIKFEKIDKETLQIYRPPLQMDFISYDNGITWQRRDFPIKLFDVSYLNQNEGFGIYKDQLYKTTDGGSSWNLMSNLKYEPKFIYFANERLGVVYSDRFAGYTNNGGSEWKYLVGY